MPREPNQPSRIRAIIMKPAFNGPWLPVPMSRSLLDRYGIRMETVDDPYGWVSLRTSAHLLEEAATVLGDPVLGARIGTTSLPEHAGPFGALYTASRTLRDVFARYDRFARLIQDHTLMEAGIGPKVTTLLYRVLDSGIAERRQDAEFSASSICSFIRTVLGQTWSPLEVQFEHMPAQDPATLRAILRAPVTFGHPVNRILIATADIDRANPAANGALEPIVISHLEELLGREDYSASPVDRVRTYVAKHLAEPDLSLGMAARELGLSSRTLQRRLGENGLSFRSLVEAERRDAADRMLREQNRPIKSIAYSLGYAEVSVFSRAWRSWTGTPPRSARRVLSS